MVTERLMPEAPLRATGFAPAGTPAVDTVSLAYAERYRRRGLLATDGGREVMLDLPEATELADGAILALPDGTGIAVRAAPEPLAEVRAEGAALARLAWHIGNRHTPAEIGEGCLRIARDHVLEGMLVALGASVRAVEAPFRPEGGAYGHGRTHAHAHGAADADPNAHIPHRHG